MIKDTICCLTDLKRLEAILIRAAGGETLLGNKQNKESILKRFGLILLGVRAHVIGDTWAHQDWCAVNNVINSYWDIDDSMIANEVWQEIEYQDIAQNWKKVHLSSTDHIKWSGNPNFEASPNGSYIGHGWMGHLPDYSFVKYRYKPCWSPKNAQALERDNPTEYNYAFLELCSLFSQAKSSGSKFQPKDNTSKLAAAQKAISSPVDIANKDYCPRAYSADKWKEEMDKVQIEAPSVLINTKEEPDENTVLSGKIDSIESWLTKPVSRYNTFYINVASDLYLFQIAADYQFHFVKNWTKTHNIGPSDLFEDSWSRQLGSLSNQILEILV